MHINNVGKLKSGWIPTSIIGFVFSALHPFWMCRIYLSFKREMRVIYIEVLFSNYFEVEIKVMCHGMCWLCLIMNQIASVAGLNNPWNVQSNIVERISALIEIVRVARNTNYVLYYCSSFLLRDGSDINSSRAT